MNLMKTKPNMQTPSNGSSEMSIDITMADTVDRMSISNLLNPSATDEDKQTTKSEDDATPKLTSSSKLTQVWLPPMIAEPIENVQFQLPYRLRVSEGHRAKLAQRKRSRTLSPPQLPVPRLSPRLSSPVPYRRNSNLGWNLGQYRISENGPLYSSSIDIYNPSTHFDTLDEPPRAKSKTRPHFSNKAYTREQVDFCRYMKLDCEMSFEEVKMLFRERFPEVLRDSNQCFSSRYYRDNVVPRLDKNGGLMFDDKGKLLLEAVKVRDRNTPEGKAKCVPCTLIDRSPWRALTYDWVSKEHKALARSILDGNDPTDPQGSKSSSAPHIDLTNLLTEKAEWRRILREAEDHM